jgi:hypothetical protein
MFYVFSTNANEPADAHALELATCEHPPNRFRRDP